MTGFLPGNLQPEKEEDRWRYELADFAKAHQQELAALSWGLWLENQHNGSVMGIDLQPTPHFVYCPKEAVLKLNETVGSFLQEVVGIVEGFNPEIEVLLVGINQGQLKVIEFVTDPPPPQCFETVSADVDTLLEQLEQGLRERIKG
jgi:hypothetical protein